MKSKRGARRPLTGMTSSWARLGVHFMNQPSLLPAPPHIVTAEEHVEPDPYVTEGKLVICPHCKTAQPVLTCICGASVAINLHTFGIESDIIPTFVPKTVYYRCSECRTQEVKQEGRTRQLTCIHCNEIIE